MEVDQSRCDCSRTIIPARMEGEGELDSVFHQSCECGQSRCSPPSNIRGDASLGRRRAQHLVPEFVPQAPIEALDEGILHGFARRDVMPFDAGVISPSQDGVAGEFAAIVADHHLRLAALDHQPVQFPRHTDAGE
jgi:hypothetical protein